MTADDFLIDDEPGGEIIDDDIFLVDEWGDPDIHEYGDSTTYDANSMIYNRNYEADSGLSDSSRGYIEISQGTTKLGYRNAYTGEKLVVATFQPTSITSGSTVYRGLALNTSTLQLARNGGGESSNWNGFKIRVGSNYPATGKLQVITNLSEFATNNPNYDEDDPHDSPFFYNWTWVIESLPFICGVCVAKR